MNAADDLKAGFNSAADDFYQALAGVGNASAATLTGVNHLIYQTATDPGKTDAQVFGTFIHGDQTFFNISKAFNHVATEGTIEEKYEAVTYVAIATLGGGYETGGEEELIAPKPEPGKPPGAKPAIEQAPPQQAPPPKRCFPAGTQILLADGSTKSIDKIKVGDKVQCEDPTNHKVQAKPVTKLIHNWTKRLIHIKVAIGSSSKTTKCHELLATGPHPIWTVNRGWVSAKDLKAGDRLLEPNGTQPFVVSSVSVPVICFTYNLTIEGTHTFFVEAGDIPVLVHNDDDAGAANTPIIGSQKPDTAASPGHFDQTNRVAEAWANSGNYKSVGVNIGYRQFLNQNAINAFNTKGMLMASGKAPDIVGLRKDGTLDVHEVASATDTEADLRARHAEAMKTLPENLKNGKPLEISNYDDTSYTLPCDQ